VCAFLLAVEHSARLGRAGGREEERGLARCWRFVCFQALEFSAVQCHRITSLLCLLLLGVGIPSQSFVRVCERESEDNCISDCPCGLTVQISSAQLSLALLLCIYHGVHRRLRWRYGSQEVREFALQGLFIVSHLLRFRTHSLDNGLETESPVASPVASRPRLNINKGIVVAVIFSPGWLCADLLCGISCFITLQK
jgi:hypothetical protein